MDAEQSARFSATSQEILAEPGVYKQRFRAKSKT
jgi:hypothetical protein